MFVYSFLNATLNSLSNVDEAGGMLSDEINKIVTINICKHDVLSISSLCQSL